MKLCNARNLLTMTAFGIGGALVASQVERMRRKISLSGKVIIITGGSRGLGLELARIAGQQGAKLALFARDAAELERAKDELTGSGYTVHTEALDVTDKNAITEAINRVAEQLGSVDVLINNAGRIQVGPMENMTLEDFEEEMKLHFWAPLHATLATIPHLKKSKNGRIVNISSIAGLMSVPHLMPYCTSKHALAGFSEGLRMELLKDDIFVTTVYPGLMRTGSHVNAEFKGQNEKEYALFSLSDALPMFSIDSKSAANEIINACRAGDSRLVITAQARFGNFAQTVLPEIYADIMGVAACFMPGPGGIGNATKLGKESQSALSPSFLTGLADAASARNNELG